MIELTADRESDVSLVGRRHSPHVQPLSLESSSPGIFFAGDVRHGSIKRVASAVAEGAMAVEQVHRFLDEHTSIK